MKIWLVYLYSRENMREFIGVLDAPDEAKAAQLATDTYGPAGSDLSYIVHPIPRVT